MSQSRGHGGSNDAYFAVCHEAAAANCTCPGIPAIHTLKKTSAPYGLHTSAKLRSLFAARPFQGAEPSSARFIFFGLDANFAADVDSTDSFTDDICPYLEDGVLFWQTRKRHHPFLLREYRGSGRKYHTQFEKIGFKPQNASQVAFVEVLHIPTSGSGHPSKSWLDPDHLARLESWVRSGAAQYVFMPPSVVELLHDVGHFGWLPPDPTSQDGSLPVLHRSARTTIYSPYHFSYRFGDPILRQQQLDDIGALIDKY